MGDKSKRGKGTDAGSASGMPEAIPEGMPDFGQMVDMMFQEMDKDEDGFITKKEMATTEIAEDENGQIGEESAETMFREMDQNGDGKVSRDEASKMYEVMAGELTAKGKGKGKGDPPETDEKGESTNANAHTDEL